jgi:hypothetical protein
VRGRTKVPVYGEYSSTVYLCTGIVVPGTCTRYYSYSAVLVRTTLKSVCVCVNLASPQHLIYLFSVPEQKYVRVLEYSTRFGWLLGNAHTVYSVLCTTTGSVRFQIHGTHTHAQTHTCFSVVRVALKFSYSSREYGVHHSTCYEYDPTLQPVIMSSVILYLRTDSTVQTII